VQVLKRYARKLGILGGMGPEATASLYLGVVSRCQRQLGAKYNSDFPPVVINSAPVPDGRMWSGFSRRRVERFLRNNIKILELAGADFVAVPCNSAHYFMPVMRDAVRIPVLSIIEETAREVEKRELSKVLLLATTFTANKCVYDDFFSQSGLHLVKLDRGEQRITEYVIVNVESGKRLRNDKAAIQEIIRKHKKADHVQGVVAGCTEIPLLVHQKDLKIPLFDTIDILASACFELITGRREFSRGV
jgi:aspartate racemase